MRKKINPSNRLRLSVFKSNQHIFAQVIDDVKSRTLVTASDLGLNLSKIKGGTDKVNQKMQKLSKTEKAKLVGELLAKKALESKIKEVFFDRGHFRYHGRIKALADSARSAGLKF